MSKTPRVSALEAAFIAEPIKYSTSHKMAVWDLARQLEQENAELREALRRIVELYADANPGLKTLFEARTRADQAARALLAKVEGK